MDFTRIISLSKELQINCLENEPMSLHTSFKIGGTADLFVEPLSEQQLEKIVVACNESSNKLFFLGCGSNIVVADAGIRGVVVSLAKMTGVSVDGLFVSALAGTKLSTMCYTAFENSLSGLEFAWGIPGSVGGALFMNAGAYGGEMSHVLESCNYLMRDGVIKEYKLDEMNLGYRQSVFKSMNGVITSAKVRLCPAASADIIFKMEDLMQRRISKQPYDMPSAGSVFKRPLNNFAGTLIEKCGLKGKTIGGAQVSEKHAGFIVNTGGATASDVKQLIEHIQETVFLQTSIKLECEILFI